MEQLRRQPGTQWQRTRIRIWQRDQGRCQGPYYQAKLAWSLLLNRAHIDHIQELSKGDNHQNNNLRTLCRRCQCLRSSPTHQRLNSILPVNWQSLGWGNKC
jgi:5-methylcytosine-specific restriction endonuclease McrA